MHEPLQNVEQAVGPQHLVPEVVRLPIALDGRVARPVTMPPVERQEVRLFTPQPRRHPHLVWVHGEVDERPLLEGEQQIAPVAVLLVLLDAVGGALRG